MSARPKIDPRALWIGVFIATEILLFFFADIPTAIYAHNLDQTTPGLIHFFRAITDLGKSIWYLVPCGLAALVCFFLSRGKDVSPAWRKLCTYIGARALFLFTTIALSGVTADIIKPIIGRARPALWLRDGIYGFDFFNGKGFLWNGFPSGHTTTVFALAYSLSLFYPRLRPLWFAYAMLIAASRVMVNAHYLSDVVGGAALGTLTVWLFSRYGINLISQVIFPIDSKAADR